MKKLLIVLLTIVLVFGMSGTAFATENGNGNGYTDMSTVEITKNVSLKNNGTTNPAEVFGFEVDFVKLVRDGIEVEGITGPAIDDFNVTVEKGQSSGTGNLVLPEVKDFSGVGEYTFKITEKSGSTAGMSYNSGEKELVILILNNGDGFMRVVKRLTNEEGKKVDSFENKFLAGDLAISKEVTGNFGDKDREFDVTITLNAPKDKEIADGTVEIDGDAVAFVDGEAIINTAIEHDQTINITNIPYGVTYTVVESDYTGEGYTTSGNVTDATAVGSALAEVKLVNSKGIDVAVGVSLDNLPYVLTLVLGLGGLALFVFRKRIFN